MQAPGDVARAEHDAGAGAGAQAAPRLFGQLTMGPRARSDGRPAGKRAVGRKPWRLSAPVNTVVGVAFVRAGVIYNTPRVRSKSCTRGVSVRERSLWYGDFSTRLTSLLSGRRQRDRARRPDRIGRQPPTGAGADEGAPD